MFYSFNSITGRLTGTTQLKAYTPQGVQKLGPSEPVNPYPRTWATAEARTYTQKPVDHQAPASARSASTSAGPNKTPAGIPYAPVPENIKRAQQLFQKADNVLIHLKGGTKDKVLYYVTMGLIAVGVVGVVQMVYKFSFPRKQE